MERLIDLGNGFWNIRGDLRLFGLLNVGTQASLVRLRSGRFVALDSCAMDTPTRDRVMALTDGGTAVEAILNLHPFHTLHCATMAQMFPQARLYGSRRHWRKWPDLPWQDQQVESADLAARLAGELDFSLPEGIDYICADQRVHAGSLLAFHPASGTVHVDDTLNVLPLPEWLRRTMGLPRLTFHPTLLRALQDRPGAADDFRRWARGIGADWAETRTVCAAHSGILHLGPQSFADAVEAALARVEPGLNRT